MEVKQSGSNKIKEGRLSTLDIIYQNLSKQLIRSSSMLILAFLLAFTLSTSSLLLESLRLGMISTSERLGADMIIVPRNYVSSIQDALFLGKPCTVYFNKSWVDKITETEGVKKVSHQMYLATLSASECCDSALQIIAFDPDTDYVIQPWIKKNSVKSLKGNRIIIGNHLNYKPGDVAKFFGEEFIVAAKMEKTGMGYDNTVFLTYSSAQELAKKPIVRNTLTFGERDNMISMITVDIEDNYNIGFVRDQITKNYGDEEIAIYETNSILSRLSYNLNQYTVYSSILNTLLNVSTIFSFLFIYSMTINERRREFGILRSIGAKGIRIIRIIVGEALIISSLGGILGTFLSGILIVSFQNYIAHLLQVPFLLPQWNGILWIAGKALLISLFSGILSSLYAAFRINNADIYYLIRSNETCY